jgi:hypothetical protein
MQLEEGVNTVYEFSALPSETMLPLSLVLRAFRAETARMRVSMDLSSQWWDVGDAVLSVDASTNEFAFSPTDFGRPVLVEARPSGTSPGGRPRIVDIADQPALDGIALAGGGVAKSDLASQVGFFSKLGQRWARVYPWPLSARDYTVFYERGPVSFQQMTEELAVIPNFHDLLCIRVVLFCNGVRRVQSAPEMIAMEAQFTRDWHEYKGNDNQESSGTIHGFRLGRRTSRRY